MPRRGKPPKYPGINIPANIADPEVRTAFEQLKEYVEMIVGDRGDPEDRLVSVAELVDAGLVKSYVKQRRAQIIKLEEDSITTISSTGGSDEATEPVPIPPGSGIQSINGDFGDGFGAVDLELDDLSDVTLTSPQQDDVIRLGATDWENVPQEEIVDGGNF